MIRNLLAIVATVLLLASPVLAQNVMSAPEAAHKVVAVEQNGKTAEKEGPKTEKPAKTEQKLSEETAKPVLAK